MRTRNLEQLLAFILLVTGAMGRNSAMAQYVPIYGGPTYDSSTSEGFFSQAPFPPPATSAGSGVGAGFADKRVAGNSAGFRAVRWDTTGSVIELETLGTTGAGSTDMRTYGINAAGVTVGYATKYVSGSSFGNRPVRWDASGAATELGNLGTTAGFTTSLALAINDAGTVVGYADAFNAGVDVGFRAVRWNASSTQALELDNLGVSSSGTTNAVAESLNSSGASVGFALKYDSGINKGARAVRWSGSTTTATELGGLGTDANGSSSGEAYRINDAGTAVGYARKFSASNANQGLRPVRWNASGTTATELGNLGTDAAGSSDGRAFDLNASGAAVGFIRKYISGANKGNRAVRWDGSNQALELAILGTDANGSSFSEAYAINDVGITVGEAATYPSGNQISHAVMWAADGTVTDLNSLIDPASGWTLSVASDITNDGWITGIARYDPPGPLQVYNRLFLMQVPEPTLMALGVGAMSLLIRRRGRFSDDTKT